MDIIVPLTENYEFKRVYARGKSVVRPTVVVYCMKKSGPAPRVGITASKKIGNAVKRNRARRVLRESTRELYPQIKPGIDLVLVSRGKTPFVNCSIVKTELASALEELGVLVSAPQNKRKKEVSVQKASFEER
ncbi:MAG: ribonuclease P protein component [Clostridia bacterium]|nr:ribonuclease P protein component [Clostridia bacterium]